MVRGPLAVVLGDLDLVSCLGMAGVRCVAVAAPDDPVRFSRFTQTVIDRPTDDAALVDTLLEFARRLVARPVLFYQTDRDLLLVSREREALAVGYDFVIPDPALVEDLVDKGRFQALAARLELPVPAARQIRAGQGHAAIVDLRFPVVVKAATRNGLDQLAIAGKAVAVETPDQLRALMGELSRTDIELLAQELVVGDETAVESYHGYVDSFGFICAEFTGAKIRTSPATFGYSTALRTSHAPDLMTAGRRLVARLGFTGVLKVDYKRDHRGALHLLEVNPRFSLWNHLGAAAGVNLPALVYADLTGRLRPDLSPARPGVTWCQLGGDRKAAVDAGVSTTSWAAWAALTRARAEGRWSDPAPLLRGIVWPRLIRAVRPAPSPS